MQGTQLGWFRAADERQLALHRASGALQLTALRIDPFPDDAFRFLERDGRLQERSLLHEADPNGQGHARRRAAQGTRPVVADPNATDERRCVTDKPRVL